MPVKTALTQVRSLQQSARQICIWEMLSCKRKNLKGWIYTTAKKHITAINNSVLWSSFNLPKLFSDWAYRRSESEILRKVSPPKLCERCRKLKGSNIIYYYASHFIERSEFHWGTLSAHFCAKAAELTNHCDSFDRVDNHRWRLLPRYLLLSFIFHSGFHCK